MATYSLCLPAAKLSDSCCSNKYIFVLAGQSTTQRDGTCRIVFNDLLSTTTCNRNCAISDSTPQLIVTPLHRELVVLTTELEVTTLGELSQGLGLWNCDASELIQSSGYIYQVEARIKSWALSPKLGFPFRSISTLANVKFSWIFIAEGGTLQPIPG